MYMYFSFYFIYMYSYVGGARYVPGQEVTQNSSSSGNRFDPFTGGSAYHPTTGHTSSGHAPSKDSAASTNPHYPIVSYMYMYCHVIVM